MKTIRVLHVVRALQTGGMENVVRRLISKLDASRFEQTVCTLTATGDPQPSGTFCLQRDADKPAFLVPQLTRVFAQWRPDIVHSRNWATIEAVPAAKLARIPGIIHSEHGRDIHTMQAQPRRRRMLRRLSLNWTDKMFCVSQELRDYYCRDMNLPPGSLDVIPNGVDTEQFYPDSTLRTAFRERIDAAASTLVVGTVSRLDPVKDHTTLLQAADKALHNGLDLKVVIIGDGPQRGAIERDLGSRPELQRRTLLTGEVRNVAEWLNSFDVFVLPSLSEGMSNTLLEAMAVGVPPIATNVGGNPEVVEHRRSGILMKPQDTDGLSECLMEMTAAEAWRRELGRHAREQMIAHFSVEHMLRRYEQMYSEIAERNGQKRSHARNTVPIQ
jgi:sugar transferase (PEP-CTERM/EpsH1 system associated)